MKLASVALAALLGATATQAVVYKGEKIPDFDSQGVPDHINAKILAANPSPGAFMWFGKVFPDGEEEFLWGEDILDVEAQILDKNPDYVATDVPEGTSANDKRNDPIFQDGNVSCKIWAAGDEGNIRQGAGKLKDVGGRCLTNARSCIRNSCYNTSGIYTCNDADSLSNLSCWSIGEFVLRATETYDQCCQSAQIFATDALYNLNWGYSNCGNSPSVPPSDYGAYPGAVNSPRC